MIAGAALDAFPRRSNVLTIFASCDHGSRLFYRIGSFSVPGAARNFLADRFFAPARPLQRIFPSFLFLFPSRCPSVQIDGEGIARRHPGFEARCVAAMPSCPCPFGRVDGAKATAHPATDGDLTCYFTAACCDRRLNFRFRLQRCGSGVSELPLVPASSSSRQCRVCAHEGGLEPIWKGSLKTRPREAMRKGSRDVFL